MSCQEVWIWKIVVFTQGNRIVRFGFEKDSSSFSGRNEAKEVRLVPAVQVKGKKSIS